MKRDFTYKDLKFHLNDNGDKGNPYREFEGKYILLMWHEGYGKWIQKATVNTKKEALQYVKDNYLYL